MRSLAPCLLLFAALLAGACPPAEEEEPPRAEMHCAADRADVDARVEAILSTLALTEKTAVMHGISILTTEGTWQSTSYPDRGVPGFKALDGPKGVGGPSIATIGTGDPTTAFPVAIARGATWNRALEKEVGAAIAGELRAVGADTHLAPVLNLAWHPQGGRVQEKYGEDPYQVGEMGVPFVQGAQGAGAISVAKHFTANHVENTRLDMSANMDESVLRQVYLPAFHKVVREAGLMGVMSAYNKVNGTYMGEHPFLLTRVLREEWGFEGFVVSDFNWGTPSTVGAANAGLDLEMQYSIFYGEPLAEAVRAGDVERDVVNEHVRRLLRVQLCAELDTAPAVPDPALLETTATRALARRVATEGLVLLRNEGNLLPLSAGTSIALLGPLHAAENVGDLDGSSGVRSSEVVSVLEGLQGRSPDRWTLDIVAEDLSGVDPVALAATDVAIVVVGLTQDDEGEGQVRAPGTQIGAGDRYSLVMPRNQDQLVLDTAAAHDRVIVLLQGGSVIDVSAWIDEVEGLMMLWYPGVEGGHAVADLLTGDAAPQGRLPLTWPMSAADLQDFDPDALEVDYGPLHGYRLLLSTGTAARYPFGFGLSYAPVSYAGVEARQDEDGVTLSFEARNDGARAVVDIPQIYASFSGAPAADAPRRLVGFDRVELDAGAGSKRNVTVSWSELERWSAEGGWAVPPGSWSFFVARHAEDDGNRVDIELTPPS